MGQMKNYFLRLLESCSEHDFGQTVVEWAIQTGRVKLTYHLQKDVRHIMTRYDDLIDEYRAEQAALESAAISAQGFVNWANVGRHKLAEAHARKFIKDHIKIIHITK